MAMMAATGEYNKEYTYDYIQFTGSNVTEIVEWLSGYDCRSTVYLMQYGVVHDPSHGSASPYIVRMDQYIILNLTTGRVEVSNSVDHLVPIS